MVVTTASLKMGGTRDLGKSLHLSHLSYLLCKMASLMVSLAGVLVRNEGVRAARACKRLNMC